MGDKAKKEKPKYKAGDALKGIELALDKYTFKTSDVTKWTKPNPITTTASTTRRPSQLKGLNSSMRLRATKTKKA